MHSTAAVLRVTVCRVGAHPACPESRATVVTAGRQRSKESPGAVLYVWLSGRHVHCHARCSSPKTGSSTGPYPISAPGDYITRFTCWWQPTCCARTVLSVCVVRGRGPRTADWMRLVQACCTSLLLLVWSNGPKPQESEGTSPKRHNEVCSWFGWSWGSVHRRACYA
jgi:hypothetical protein